MMPFTLGATSGVTARRPSISSPPSSSSVSDMMTVPPASMTRSARRPVTVGDDAGRTVGAAAFHAEDEFAPRHGFGAQAARIVKHLDGGLSGAIRHFHGAALIFDGEAHHGLAALRDLAGNVFGGLIFQSHDYDAVHVGMQGGIDGEEVVQGKVFVHFAAAEPGAKRHATLHQRAYAPHRRIGVVHRSDDGDMVAECRNGHRDACNP